MILSQQNTKVVDVQQMAGFGPIAWNQGSERMKVSGAVRRHSPHLVRIDHEARKRQVEADTETDAVRIHPSYGEPEPSAWKLLVKTSVGFLMVGLLYLTGT